jgi:hypothetical protein
MIGWWVALAFGTTLAGRVSDGFGDPVEGAMIVAYDVKFAYEYTFTDAEGAWRIADLPDRAWRVRALPPMSVDRVETWYPGALAVCLAQPIPAGEHEDLRLELVIGGRVSGRVVDADGAPVAGVLATLESTGVGGVQEREATTDADGRYTIVGVPSPALGPWRVRLDPPVGPDQYVGGVVDPDEAATFAPSSGVVDDAGVHALIGGASLGGAVAGPDGPVTSGTLRLYAGQSTVDLPISEGRWRADGVSPGDVTFWAISPGLATTFWPAADRPPAERLVVEDGEERLDLDLRLPAAAAFTGALRGPGDLSGVGLVLYNDDETIGLSAAASSDGAFSIDGLYPGRYSISVFGAEEGFASGRIGGITAPATFEAPDEDVELRLVRAAEISGRITDAETGAPIYGASVIAESLLGRRVGATTDADGAYRLTGLSADAWLVRAEFAAPCPSDPDWVAVSYPGVVDPDLAGRMFLSPGDDARFDAALLADTDHDGMSDTWEGTYRLDPLLADELEDPDGDGYSNLEEFYLGSDPRAAVTHGCAGVPDGQWGALIVLALWRRRR